MKTRPLPLLKSFVHPARTTLAAVLALWSARILGLPEVYWAPISALIVMQKDFGASLVLSWQRLAGTALGAFVGSLLATHLGASVLSFALGVFTVGVVSIALRLDRAANRFAAIALAIVMLASPRNPAWIIAIHRLIEVSVGIVVGLLVSTLWPERADGAARTK
jgi:uncharacterized membrane protein YgaE (UPF0421/DUF939 family)